MDNATKLASSSALEALPLYLLELICEHLEQCDPERRSLCAFSLANKCCYIASTRQRFKQIRLIVWEKEKLHQDIEQLRKVLDVDERIKYVRQVKIVGFVPRRYDDETAVEKEIAALLPSKSSSETDQDERGGVEDDSFKPSRGFLEKFVGPRWWTCKERAARNEAWQPLARLLERIPQLRDLVYAGHHQIPECIFTALDRFHPNTRLHVHTLTLSDLDDKIYCTLLFRSPCLYSIVILYKHNGFLELTRYNPMIISCLMGMARRLKYVRIWHCPPIPSRHDRMPKHSRETSFMADHGVISLFKGKFQELILGLEAYIDPTGFNEVQLQFPPLHFLEIRDGVNIDVIRTLGRTLKKGGFQSLHTLAL